MRVENITENSSLIIDEKYVVKLKEILSINTDLPIKLVNNTVFFDDYTVGEFRVDDLTININPRNSSFTLESFFKILQFIDCPLSDDVEGFGFEETRSLFKFDDISSHFCMVCKNLLQFGLTGSYTEEIIQDNTIHGEIVFEKYYPQLLPYQGIPSNLITYDLNIKANQILKLALLKLIRVESFDKNPEKYQILRELDQVDEKEFSFEEVSETISIFFSSNPYYTVALEYASKILFDLKLEFKNGQIEWLAFLENSNVTFEKYVFKIVELFLPEKIEKWGAPKKFAKLKSKSGEGMKSFSPDIMINFNKKTQICKAVLDVKNKVFEPSNKSNYSELISSSDLYQILFYCRQLKTKVGGLIYPSSTSNDPIQITLDSKDEIIIFLFSINMKEGMKSRHEKLIKELHLHILSKT